MNTKSLIDETVNKPLTHQPCPCGKSSDAFTYNLDGSGKCFRGDCDKFFLPGELPLHTPPIENAPEGFLSPINGLSKEIVPWRGVTRETMARYGVFTWVDGETPQRIVYPYSENASKIRWLTHKKFYSEGPISKAGLFGKSQFPPGSAKTITITEGELDALSVFQMLGSKYPAVSIQTSGSAERDCTMDRDYLNSFDKIVLAFDNDPPGQKAAENVAKLFNYNKIYFLKLTEGKDANEYLSEGKQEQFVRSWWNAEKYTPTGLLGAFKDIRETIKNRNSSLGVPLPMPTLNEMLGGLRTGEIYLFTAETGVGKTEITHWIEVQLLRTTDENIGVIHIEEPKEETIARLAGYELGKRSHLPGDATEEEIISAFEKLVKRDHRLWIYTQYGSDDPSVIVDKIRWMVTALGCKYIILDHISKVVSGLGREEDRRIAIEWICDALDNMRTELGFTIIMVSHVNNQGGTFNSGAPARVTGSWVHLTRDITSDNEFTRRITRLQVLKNRPGGVTGPAGMLLFDEDKYLLSEFYENEELPS